MFSQLGAEYWQIVEQGADYSLALKSNLRCSVGCR